MRIPITDVPIAVRRVAAQHFESLRGTELMNGVEDSYLDAYAVPICRPDINGIAYYEFTVLGGGGRILLTRGYSAVMEAEASKARHFRSISRQTNMWLGN